VAGLGGTSSQIGLIIGLFAFMAMILRPPSGWLIDTRGNRPVLLAGMAIFLLASLGYILTPSVQGILALRLFHGMGMGLFPTAATVVVAELAPPARRGEAMGWFGFANSLAFVAGPTAGLAVVGGAGYTSLFLLAAGVAAMGIVCILLLPHVGRRPVAAKRLPRLRDVFSRPALLPSSILLFLYFPYGTLVAFIPLIATGRGLGNPGLFYAVYALAMLLVRSKAGEISDRRGRAAVIIPGMVVAALAMMVLGLTSGPVGVLVAAAIFGVGFGMVQPTLMALTTDRVPAEERGKAMGTFYTAWELGIAAGAAGSGWLLNITGFPVVLLTGAGIVLIGAVLSLRARPTRGEGRP
jgi:MFS family permease